MSFIFYIEKYSRTQNLIYDKHHHTVVTMDLSDLLSKEEERKDTDPTDYSEKYDI